jgi:hypothetical protein
LFIENMMECVREQAGRFAPQDDAFVGDCALVAINKRRSYLPIGLESGFEEILAGEFRIGERLSFSGVVAIIVTYTNFGC